MFTNPRNEDSLNAEDTGAPRSEPPTPDAETSATITAADVVSRDACEQLFVASLPLIQRVIGTVARRYRLSADEAEEFTAAAQLRIIKDDYAVFRKFRGRCTLRTFLTIVIQRMFLDYRNAQWGKWRPSVASRRYGEVAVLLERLTLRDGFTFEEACSAIEASRGEPIDRAALAAIHVLHPRRGRPRFIADDSLEEASAHEKPPDDRLIEAEGNKVVASAAGTLADALAAIATEDRLILKLRFRDELNVSEIARVLQLDQHGLYARLSRLLGTLRRFLESHGVSGAELLLALDCGATSTVDVFGASQPPMRVERTAEPVMVVKVGTRPRAMRRRAVLPIPPGPQALLLGPSINA
jgi:RNA polymerase sigma factor (sigma-70 family)